MKKTPIILVGGGGHCHSCIDVIEKEDRFTIVGVVDLPGKQGQTILGYPVIGTDDDLPNLVNPETAFLITIGQIGSPSMRKILYRKLKELNATLPVIISPLAYVSPHARVAEGTIVLHGVIINACASIGTNCIINTNSLIEHDSVVGDHCHIATGAIVNGGVDVGDETFLGSGAVTRQNTSIPAGSFVKANAIVR